MLVNVHNKVVAAFLRRGDAGLLPLCPSWIQGGDFGAAIPSKLLGLSHKASRCPEKMCPECPMLGLEVFHGDGFSLQAELCDSFDDLSLVDMESVQRTVDTLSQLRNRAWISSSTMAALGGKAFSMFGQKRLQILHISPS